MTFALEEVLEEGGTHVYQIVQQRNIMALIMKKKGIWSGKKQLHMKKHLEAVSTKVRMIQ